MIDLGIPTGVFNNLPWYESPDRDKGHHCGECGRLLKVYNRRLSRSMTRSLIRLYLLSLKYPDKTYFHVKTFDKEGARGEFGVLSCWGLVAEEPNADESKRTSGMWSMTEFGKNFIRLQEHVPQYVILKWGSECLGFSGPMVTAKQCLEHANKFRYDDLMRWSPDELPF
jgi:hypothetical protein